MHKNILRTISFLFILTCLFAGSSLFFRVTALSAPSIMEPVSSTYRQLVSENKDQADIVSDIDLMAERNLFQKELFSIDDPDNYYDGLALYARAQWIIAKYGTRDYSIYPKEGTYATVAELEELTDRMLSEIHDKYDDTDASPREKYYDIAVYLTDTFDYDHDTADNNMQDQDQVTAYYGNRLITCRGYSYLLYLLCKKSGIDCKLILGTSHIYNLIRFDDNSPYYAVDLSGDDPHGYLGFADMYILRDPSYHPEYNEDETARDFDLSLNEGLSYVPAGMKEYAMQSFHYLKIKGLLWELKTNWNFYLLILAILLYIIVFIRAVRKKIRHLKS